MRDFIVCCTTKFSIFYSQIQSNKVNDSKNQEIKIQSCIEQDIKTDDKTLTAYVDGSYNIETMQFSYGMVLLINGEEICVSKHVDEPEIADMRNVAGEIKGAQAAMQYAVEHQFENLIIYHDYEGIAKWCLGVWKTNKEGTKAYKAYYDSIKDKLNVSFIKVKGHSNNKYNDMADELAKKAIFDMGEDVKTCTK